MTTGKLQVLEPLDYTPTSSNGSDTGLSNLTSKDPKEVFQASSTASRNIFIDAWSSVTLGGVFIGYTNAVAATAQVFKDTGASGAGAVAVTSAEALRPSDCKTVRSNLWLPFTPDSSRYWHIALSSNSTALQIGALAIGNPFEAEWDKELGHGRRPIDTAQVQQLLSGGFGVEDGAKKAAFNWTFGDLTDAELEQLWGVAIRVGRSSPVVIVEREGASNGASEQVHYGLLQTFEKFERRDPSATKWSLEIEEWI